MTPDYAKQRAKTTPPHVSLRALRVALHLKQDEVCHRVQAITGKSFTTGALSAIENGHRGASPETLAALTQALGLADGDLVVNYEPTHPRRRVEAVAS